MTKPPSAKQQRAFLAEYKKYARSHVLPGRTALRSLLHQWRQPGFWAHEIRDAKRATPTPVQRTVTRIKRPESVVDKIFRKPESFPNGLSLDSIERMHDVLGGRVITYFLSGLPIIDRELHRSPALEIVTEIPPVAYLDSALLARLGLSHLHSSEKESGYASIHYIVRVKVDDRDRDRWPIAEIQVRTLAEDIWGEVEHLLGYKPDKRTSFAVTKQFQIIGTQLQAIDEHFNFLHEELQRFQAEAEIEDTAPLNAENLPRVLAQLGIGCAQREVDSLLKLLVSRGIRTVRDFHQTARPNVIEVIRNAYRHHEGRDPINFETVASIAAVGNVREPKQINDIVRAQIDFLKGWEKMKHEFESVRSNKPLQRTRKKAARR